VLCACVCVCVYVYVFVFKCMCVCVCVCFCVCVYARARTECAHTTKQSSCSHADTHVPSLHASLVLSLPQIISLAPMQELKCERVYIMAIAHILNNSIMVYFTEDPSSSSGLHVLWCASSYACIVHGPYT